MKVAQALNLKKKLDKDAAALTALIQSIAVQTVGSPKPEKEPGELVDALLKASEEKAELVIKIQASNLKTQLPNGMTVADAIVRRNAIHATREHMVQLLEVRMYHREQVVTLDLSKVRRICDDLSRRWRELDDLIQQSNWNTDI
jgi:hypothetical protein